MYNYNIEKIKNNPNYWSNNKRKRKGLPLRRKGTKKKKDFYLASRKEIFLICEKVLEELIPLALDDNFKNFVDVKDISLGDKSV